VLSLTSKILCSLHHRLLQRFQNSVILYSQARHELAVVQLERWLLLRPAELTKKDVSSAYWAGIDDVVGAKALSKVAEHWLLHRNNLREGIIFDSSLPLEVSGILGDPEGVHVKLSRQKSLIVHTEYTTVMHTYITGLHIHGRI
jgi:hypothetical protein